MHAVSNDILPCCATLRKLPAVTCCPDVLNQEVCTIIDMCSVLMCLQRTAITLHTTCLSADLSKPELAGLWLSSSLALYLDIMQQQVPLAGVLSIHFFSAWLHQCEMTAIRSVVAIRNFKNPLDVDLQAETEC